MISKELFIETLQLIEKKHTHENILCEALELCSPQEYVNAFIYSEYEDLVTKILKSDLNIKEDNDILDWWIWELNFGKDFKLGSFVVEDKIIDLSTTEKLYDYLVNKTNKEN